jgi:hypothetical protein
MNRISLRVYLLLSRDNAPVSTDRSGFFERRFASTTASLVVDGL